MRRVLVIVTGGTITMVRNPQTGGLRPADHETFLRYIPEIEQNEEVEVSMHMCHPLIDSSDVNPELWNRLTDLISYSYDQYDGFVVLHGTDTMAYSASALSFALENLTKPVVFTGSQLPVGVLRSDAKENLLTSIEIAAAVADDGYAMVPEVCVYFEDSLYRANRVTKFNAEHFEAFDSYNYPSLAKAGVHITYRTHLIHYTPMEAELITHRDIDPNIVVIRLFPGITEQAVRAMLHTEGLRGVVLETYGSGNAPSAQWLYRLLKDAVNRGIVIVNKTQCSAGSVDMGHYEVSLNLIRAGVISGFDITMEALVTKMMYVLGEETLRDKIIYRLQHSQCGEMTVE